MAGSQRVAGRADPCWLDQLSGLAKESGGLRWTGGRHGPLRGIDLLEARVFADWLGERVGHITRASRPGAKERDVGGGDGAGHHDRGFDDAHDMTPAPATSGRSGGRSADSGQLSQRTLPAWAGQIQRDFPWSLDVGRALAIRTKAYVCRSAIFASNSASWRVASS